MTKITFNNSGKYQDIIPKSFKKPKEGFYPKKIFTKTNSYEKNINKYKQSKNKPREIKDNN